ncbi:MULTISPECIES: HAD family hydrolase [Falsihalocynthiibacter]|uniref:HAD family hydrolase n=1 Tax=Falsihalocynthiibacter TaxID=2854182 RepID=UPI003001247C
MADIKGILFDKDGTLFDFHTSWGRWTLRFLEELAAGNAAKQRVLADALGFDIDKCRFKADSRVIAGTPDDIISDLLPHLPGASREGLLQSINHSTATAEMIEAAPLGPLLRGLLARGLVLGVATNDAEVPALAHLRAAKIEEHFEYVVGFDSGYGAKPAPGMCLGFCQKTGLDPSSVVMVGDSRHDLSAGRAAGMKTAAVLTGVATERDLAPFADVVMPHIGHLPAWLEAQTKQEERVSIAS